MSKAKVPPSPWLLATTLPKAQTIGITPGARVVVRHSRKGGWRLVTARTQVVLNDKVVGQYIRAVRANGRVVEADQVKAEQLFLDVIRAQDAGMPVAAYRVWRRADEAHQAGVR